MIQCFNIDVVVFLKLITLFNIYAHFCLYAHESSRNNSLPVKDGNEVVIHLLYACPCKLNTLLHSYNITNYIITDSTSKQ